MQLSGELSKVNLPNLLQLVKTGGLSGKISFQQGAKAATVFIELGSPVHAETEGEEGVEGLMELFLWNSGTFSFNEESIEGLPVTIFRDDPDMSFERLLKEGIAYAEEKHYLDELAITHRSVLTPTGTAVSFAKQVLAMPGLERLDGNRTLAEALGDLQLTKREYVRTVSSWIADGLADLVAPGMGFEVDDVELPNWVISRLKQDNPNISQAIIDMVIWVDRIKCWMFQVDVDFYRIRKELENAHGAGAVTTQQPNDPFALEDPAVFNEPAPPPADQIGNIGFSSRMGSVRYGDASYWRGSHFSEAKPGMLGFTGSQAAAALDPTAAEATDAGTAGGTTGKDQDSQKPKKKPDDTGSDSGKQRSIEF